MPMKELIPEIKLEDEINPYDVVLTSTDQLDEVPATIFKNEDTDDDDDDPFTETYNDDADSTSDFLDTRISSVSFEECHQDYDDYPNVSRQSPFNENNYVWNEAMKDSNDSDEKRYEPNEENDDKIEITEIGYLCKICETTFSFLENCRQHINMIHPNNDYDNENLHEPDEENPKQKFLVDDKIDRTQSGYLCLICGKTFGFIKNCRRHIKTLHPNGKMSQNPIKKYLDDEKIEITESGYLCRICEKTFSFLRNCRRHIKTIHSNNDYFIDDDKIEIINNGFLCRICMKTFSLLRNCRHHLKMVHPEQILFLCKYCGENLKCLEKLQKHIARKHECNESEKISEKISEKKLKSKEKNITRSLPVRIIKTAWTNIKDIEQLFAERLYSKPTSRLLVECKLCDTTFETSKDLRQHLENHRVIGGLQQLQLNDKVVQHFFPNINDLEYIKDVICSDIRKKDWFKYYTVLNEHFYEMSLSDTEVEDLETEEEQTAERTAKYKCSLCVSCEFSFKYQVLQHLKEYHKNNDIALKCDKCNLPFISIKMFSQHTQTHCHNKYKKLLCARCPAKFLWTENIKNHNCVISMPPVYKFTKPIIRCALCPNSFKSLQHLRDHLPLHEDGKTGIDFDDCIYVKNFKESIASDRTSLEHEIQNAYSKSQISRFYQAINKYGNELDISDSDSDTDTNGKEYVCDLCKCMFNRRKLLLNHQQERHNDVPSLPFACKDCNEQFVSFYLLEKHLKRVCWNEHRSKVQQCDQCKSRFIWPDNLQKHKEVQHPSVDVTEVSSVNKDIIIKPHSDEAKLHYCLLCPQTFNSVDYLHDHLSGHHLTPVDVKTAESIVHSTWWPNGIKIILCKKCGLLFPTMASLRNHFKNSNNLQCGNQNLLSNYSITNRKGFELHLNLDSETEADEEMEDVHKKMSSQPYKCCMCSKSFKRKYQMAQHQRSSHNYELLKLKCDLCIFRTASKKILEYHKIMQCFNIEKQYKCNQCNFKFMWQENLENHVTLIHTSNNLDNKANVHIPETVNDNELQSTSSNCQTFQCVQCDMIFAQNSSFQDHLRTHTHPYQCTNCTKAFPSYFDYKIHMRVHTEDTEDTREKFTQSENGKWLCPYCGIYLASNGGLTIHVRQHTGERPYKCDYCEKGFTRKSDLTEHRRIHTDERPYKCMHCDKAFPKRQRLNEHILTHTGERPHQCPYCKKSFRMRNYFNLHLRMHTGVKPHKCGVCDQSFTCGAYLKKHRIAKGHHVENKKD